MSIVQETVNELSRLYRLKREGKKVDALIERLNELLKEYCILCEQEQMDAEKTNEKNN